LNLLKYNEDRDFGSRCNGAPTTYIEDEFSGGICMHLTDALALVDPKWARDFVSFVETGEASDEFIAFLDTSKECQRAVDMVLEQESGKVARVAQLLREPAPRSQAASASFAHAATAQPSALIAEALGAALALPAEQRTEVIKKAVATVQNGSRDREALQSMVTEMAHQVDVSVR
jgi:hypothetical protein